MVELVVIFLDCWSADVLGVHPVIVLGGISIPTDQVSKGIAVTLMANDGCFIPVFGESLLAFASRGGALSSFVNLL